MVVFLNYIYTQIIQLIYYTRTTNYRYISEDANEKSKYQKKREKSKHLIWLLRPNIVITTNEIHLCYFKSIKPKITICKKTEKA
jgi:hypothetical protein